MKFEDFSKIEATHMDYKTSLEEKRPKTWLKSVSAFANTHGGHILFGVTDKDHKAIGLDDAQATASKISEFISSRIEPAVRYELNEFEGEIEGRACIDLSIANGPNYPYYYVNEQTRQAYVRRGDRSELATVIELNNLILKGMNKTYDALPSKYKLSDVSFTLLAATFKKETGDSFDPDRDLLSMSFVDETNTVTNAGLLLCDQGYLRQSKIVCTRWKGTEKGSIDGDALDDQVFSGTSLIMLLSNAEAFIRTNSKNPWTIRGMRREEKSDYPFKAVREVLVNAMIHRDYQNLGAEVHVDMYDNRMEISSPGGMMNGSRIQDLDLYKVPSMRRNQVISDIFDRLNLMDRRGSGIQRILNSYTDYAEHPTFYSDEYSFLVTLPNRSVVGPSQMELDFDIDGDFIGAQNSGEPKTQLPKQETQLLKQETQLSKQETQLSKQETQLLDEDKLKLNLKTKANGTFRDETIEKLVKLLLKYGYTYSFNRSNIADFFNVSENAASRIIKRSLECDIMRREKKGVYYFVE